MLWIVDDDPDETFLVARALRRTAPHISLRTFTDPQEALTAVSRISNPADMPKLIASDLNMPGWDGIEFFQQLEDLCLVRALALPGLVLITGAIPNDITLRTQSLHRLLGVETKPNIPQDLAQVLVRYATFSI